MQLPDSGKLEKPNPDKKILKDKHFSKRLVSQWLVQHQSQGGTTYLDNQHLGVIIRVCEPPGHLAGRHTQFGPGSSTPVLIID